MRPSPRPPIGPVCVSHVSQFARYSLGLHQQRWPLLSFLFWRVRCLHAPFSSEHGKDPHVFHHQGSCHVTLPWRLTLRQFASTMDFHNHQFFPFLDEALFRASADASALPSTSMSPRHCSQCWYAKGPCTTRLTPQKIAASIAPRYIADSPCIQLIGPLAVRFSHSQLPRGALGS